MIDNQVVFAASPCHKVSNLVANWESDTILLCFLTFYGNLLAVSRHTLLCKTSFLWLCLVRYHPLTLSLSAGTYFQSLENPSILQSSLGWILQLHQSMFMEVQRRQSPTYRGMYWLVQDAPLVWGQSRRCHDMWPLQRTHSFDVLSTRQFQP